MSIGIVAIGTASYVRILLGLPLVGYGENLVIMELLQYVTELLTGMENGIEDVCNVSV
jgi:hypothetical protein